MKKLTLCLLALLVAFAPAAVFADSIQVTGNNPLNGNFSMELDHDNTSGAFVQDNTPNDKVYRAEFLFRVNSVSFSGAPTNFRQSVIRGLGPNPGQNNGQGLCVQGAAFANVFECFHYRVFGGAVNTMTCFPYGDFCGPLGVGPLIRIDDGPDGVDTNGNGIVRPCLEIEMGASNTGVMRFAVVDETDSCASATYQERNLTNNQHTVDLLRLGTPQTNGFNAGETAEYQFDDFASFRVTAN